MIQDAVLKKKFEQALQDKKISLEDRKLIESKLKIVLSRSKIVQTEIREVKRR